MDEKCAEFEEQLQKEQNRTLGRMPHAPDMVTVFTMILLFEGCITPSNG